MFPPQQRCLHERYRGGCVDCSLPSSSERASCLGVESHRHAIFVVDLCKLLVYYIFVKYHKACRSAMLRSLWWRPAGQRLELLNARRPSGSIVLRLCCRIGRLTGSEWRTSCSIAVKL